MQNPMLFLRKNQKENVFLSQNLISGNVTNHNKKLRLTIFKICFRNHKILLPGIGTAFSVHNTPPPTDYNKKIIKKVQLQVN